MRIIRHNHPKGVIVPNDTLCYPLREHMCDATSTVTHAALTR